MRDLLVTLVVFASLPLILRRPATGALMWVWISVMNPHTQGWGFATRFPYAAIIAGVTMFSMLLMRGPRALPCTPLTLTLIAFIVWMNVGAPFAMFFDDSLPMYVKVMKIMLMTLVCMMLIRTREQIHQLIWVLVISLGFYGIKGGLFTLRSGGGARVWGPGDSFIGENNAFALALIMAIPLMVHLHQTSRSMLVRGAMVATAMLSALAALGTYSRGGLLAMAAMSTFLWLKSRRKAAMGGTLALCAPLAIIFMPQEWSMRMDSIGDYEIDASAQGRINAWGMALNLASERLTGGGFAIYNPVTFAMYARDPADVHAAHSIYFQVLGEHGFPGLALYLLLGWLTWRSCAAIIASAEGDAGLHWAGSLATMVQTSMVGFAVGGAFLSLLYFDVPYYLMGAIVATRVLVARPRRALEPPCTFPCRS